MKLLYKKIKPDGLAPTKAFDLDAGFDVYSREDAIVKPGGIHVFNLGIAVKLQPTPDQEKALASMGLSWYWRAADKSGLAAKNGITILGAVTPASDPTDAGKVLGGVIDRNYRGEIGIVVANVGFFRGQTLVQEQWVVKPGMKICQLVPTIIADCREAQEVTDLDTTDRGSGGFGHTGT